MKNFIKLFALLFSNLILSQTQESSFSKGLKDGWNETLKEAKNIDIYKAGSPDQQKCTISPAYTPNDNKKHEKEYGRGYRCGVEQATKIIPILQQRLQNKTFGSDIKINTNNENIDYSNSDKNTDKFNKYSDEFSNYMNNINKNYSNDLQSKLIDYGEPVTYYNQNDSFQQTQNYNYNRNYTSKELELIKFKNTETFVLNSGFRFMKISEKITNKTNSELKKETARNIKYIKKFKNYDIDSLKNGWYEAFSSFNYDFSKKEKGKIVVKRFVLINNGKIEYYIGDLNLIYKINYQNKIDYNEEKSTYFLSFLYPDSKTSDLGTYEITILNNQPLSIIPEYKYPKCFTVYSNANFTNRIVFRIFDSEKKHEDTRFITNYNSTIKPNCDTKYGVYTFYLPDGNYKFYAFTENYQEFWSNDFLIKNNCHLLNLTK
ncbi:hypothetical protein [Flavobacterium facile]|uniref:hypothetical protein n=1 Tax=Flavobacterium facile TaxID=2893174 RepID=UPI002E7A30C8|nr:hypothetical protein [Flavobacterium sp. T-12]